MDQKNGASPMGWAASYIDSTITGSRRSDPRRALRSMLAAVLLAAISISLPGQLAFAAKDASETEVKIAYLYNFARYVGWPSSAFASDDAPIVICVLGGGSFVGEAKAIIGSRKVGEHGVQVVARPAVGQTGNCHILYIPESASGQHAEVIASLGSRSVFTVSESAGFAQEGGVANFIRENRKIRFEINRKAADKAGLKVSARLLRVAKVVG
jgi:hypothetical protein